RSPQSPTGLHRPPVYPAPLSPGSSTRAGPGPPSARLLPASASTPVIAPTPAPAVVASPGPHVAAPLSAAPTDPLLAPATPTADATPARAAGILPAAAATALPAQNYSPPHSPAPPPGPGSLAPPALLPCRLTTRSLR